MQPHAGRNRPDHGTDHATRRIYWFAAAVSEPATKIRKWGDSACHCIGQPHPEKARSNSCVPGPKVQPQHMRRFPPSESCAAQATGLQFTP